MASYTVTAEDNCNEIAVYNKGELLCLVVHSEECKNICLSDFRSNVLIQQVPNNLPAAFLSVRHVGEKEITIKKKQEHLFKVRQCLKLKDGLPTLYISDEIIMLSSQQSVSTHSSQSSECKRKLQGQATLSSFGFKIPSKSCEHRLSFAKARNVKLYSDKEIQNSTGKMKEYREFWNKKVEEICSEAEFEKFSKAAVHGVINTAWTLKKADDMLSEAKDMATTLKNVPTLWLSGSAGCESTLCKNIQRLEKAREDIKVAERSLTKTRLEIIDIRKRMQAVPADVKEKINELEGKILPSRLFEVRASEDSLRKTISKNYLKKF